MPYMGNPLEWTIQTNISQPHFSGSAAEWPEFRRRWEEYWGIHSRNAGATPELKLMLFLQCVHEMLRKEAEILRKRKQLSFDRFWLLLEGRYGAQQEAFAHREWYKLEMSHSGKFRCEIGCNFAQTLNIVG